MLQTRKLSEGCRKFIDRVSWLVENDRIPFARSAIRNHQCSNPDCASVTALILEEVEMEDSNEQLLPAMDKATEAVGRRSCTYGEKGKAPPR